MDPALELLAPLPPDGGLCHSTSINQGPLAGGHQVEFVFAEGVVGLRVITALFDSAGRPGMISDLVSFEGGRRQESLGARVEPDGQMSGTHWLVEGDHHTPKPLTQAEQDGLRVLAQAVWDRCCC